MVSMFSCSNCHHTQLKWSGQCSSCGQWNTLSEEEPIVDIRGSKKKVAGKRGEVKNLVPRSTSQTRIPVESVELAGVLG